MSKDAEGRSAMRFARGLLVATIMSLTACGGGGQEASAPASPVTPTPPSTGSNPPAEPATLFSGALMGSFTGQVVFDTSGDGVVGNLGDVTVATNRAGQFGRDVADAPSLNSSSTAPIKATYRMSASGFDNITGHFYSGLSAPAGATVISPLTSLIDVVGSQDTVRQALGLNNGPYVIDPNVNLLTFDASKELKNATSSISHDAHIVSAVNMMILNLGIIATYPATSIDNRVEVDDVVGVIASMIKDGKTVRFDESKTFSSFLQKIERFSIIEDRSFDGASNILLKYWNFIQPYTNDEDSIYRSASLFRYYIASLALHAADRFYYPVKEDVALEELKTMMEYVSEVPRPDVISNFYALPDYMDTSFNSILLTQCDFPPAHPGCNDYNQLNGLRGAGAETLTIVSVSVTKSSGLISAQVNPDGSILIERKPLARGLAYFDYVIKNAEGKMSTSRYYITLYPSG